MPIATNPVINLATKVPGLSWLVAALGQVNVEAVQKDVTTLQRAHLAASAPELAQYVINEAAWRAAGIGFATNFVPPLALMLLAVDLGAIAALVGPRDLILADQYNHSSLKNGARLSGATICEYPHGDCTALNQMLNQQRPQHRRCLVITDSVFSMDGDLAPLPAILALARQFDSMVLVDEAHATGVLGATGAGGVEHLGCTGQPLVQVGTLS
ncbi:MAG: aminotransferase class I/II-fold pyridoxal phosphate-dependent enzyme, partial [Spirulinaceae cyanobacterium RM2_2_10]|nr:aminotransferase class I/II-fold pyridoxal phosphate-dependent enzyme [Spirulinaceae cyanobacterium RM2_2_10]